MSSSRVSSGTLYLVLDQIKLNPAITDSQIAFNLGLRRATIYTAVLTLQNRKLIRRDAEQKVWVLAEHLHKYV